MLLAERPLVKTQMPLRVIGFFLACIYHVITGCGTQPLPGNITRDAYLQQGLEARKQSTGARPQLGLALAGGGTKAADFSIGVLQGLTEAQVMERVDAVSTVSGGGYAALWYFSRILNPSGFSQNTSGRFDHKEFAKKFFTDCIPWKYVDAQFVSSSLFENQTSLDYRSSGNCPQKPLTNFANETGFQTDQVRYQNHLRGYQDIFAWNWRSPFRYEETTNVEEKRGVNLEFAGSVALTVLSSMANFVPNVLFDWEIPMSSSRKQYEAGILRAFGAAPTNCGQTGGCVPSTRPIGSESFVRHNLTFELLWQEYEKGVIPLWIINATAGENRDLFSAIAHPGQKPFQLTSFEFSPYGSGSGLFRYSRHALSDLKPWEAVTISAAFLDAQQRIISPVWANIFMNITTLNWGRSFPNPHVSWFESLFHKLLPTPLYLLHRRSGDSPGDFVNIRLSDGGQSEDLGAYALIQRKLPDLIISDHSSDRSGHMEDICRLKNGLAKEHGDDTHLYVYFPGLSELDRVCERDSRLGYDIFNWDHPIILGCISSDRENNDCTKKRPIEQRHFQHVYLIKPSFPSAKNQHVLGQILSKTSASCRDGSNISNCQDSVQKACQALPAGTSYPYTLLASFDSPQSWPYENYMTCELLGFMMVNAFTENGRHKVDQCPYVPQNSTAFLTADSSPFLFGAYRELGRYYARQLGWFFGKVDEQPIGDQLKLDRYRRAISYQRENPLRPEQIELKDSKAGRVGACLQEVGIIKD